MVKIDLLFPFLRLILTRKAHHTPPGWSLEWPGSIDDVPEVLDWIQVWGMDRSVNSYNSFIIPPATSWDRRNSEPTAPTVGLMISSQTGTLEIHATLQRYALPSATHHQTWPTGNCSRHQIILHRVSRLSHVCSVWTGCHLWRDQGASGKSAKSAVLQGDVAEGCQHRSPLLDIRPFYHPSCLFQMVWVETCTEAPCQRLLCGGLAVLLMLSVTV